MKTCSKCGETKPREEFSRNRSVGDGLQSRCRACNAEWLRQHRRENPEWWRNYNRRYKAENREKIREQAAARYARNPDSARQHLAWRIQREFGLALDEYEALVTQPCALCGATENIVLDHCHETGEVRGPLCQTCNKAIGMLGDDPARLRAAAAYIETFQ